MNDRNIEQLLLQANPVLDPEELRLTADEVDARCASILERRGAMQTQTQTRRDAASPPPRRWRKPALAFVISLLVVLIAAGGVALLVGGDDPEVADEPTVTTATTTPTTTTPTTVPETGLEGPITAPSYAAVPSFSGVVEYYEHDPTLGDPGWQATVAIKHAGPMLYEAEVLSGGPPYLGQVGATFLGDGSATWLSQAEEMPVSMLSDFDHFGHLYFDSEPFRSWSETCAEGTVLGTEILLGRSTTHAACSTATEDYELWVDQETGIVLKLAGPLGIGDFTPYADRDGGFAFTELVPGPVTITAAPDGSSTSIGEFPAFHMVRNEWPGAVEYWYRNAETKRRTVVSAEDEAWIGTYELFANGRISGCITHPQEQYCWDDLLEAVPAGAVYSQVPQELVESSCAEAEEATVAGRSARHFRCEGVEFAIAEDEYYAVDDPRITSEYWYDVDSELLLRSIGTGQDVEATLLDLNPVFQEGVFDYVELVPPPDRLGVGDRAPLWSGPLVGGGQFDLVELQGNPVVVFNWFPSCGDACIEGLDLVQRLYEQYAEEIEFVTVSEDTESETTRVLERRSNTVPAVFCVAEAFPYTDPACSTPDATVDPWEASPWFLWGNPIPSTTVLDADGVVVSVFTGPIEYGDRLDELLGAISGLEAP